MWFDYFGLNHLGWLRAAHDADGDRLPELLADDAALAASRRAGCSAATGCGRSG